ncbi:hypothetical protein HK102_002062 [Quaeritorhiza haematococci]|nr:hypothetical protein HK102_002062 [Quaeritorhiza haematococci]
MSGWLSGNLGTSLGGLASKVTTYTQEMLTSGQDSVEWLDRRNDPAYKKKNEGEDAGAGWDGSFSPKTNANQFQTIEELERLNNDLRVELHRVQGELTEQLAQRDRHIYDLESRINELRQEKQANNQFQQQQLQQQQQQQQQQQKPQQQPNDQHDLQQQLTETQQRAQVFQEKLTRAVGHLRRLTEENANLSQRVMSMEQEMATREAAFQKEIEGLKSASVSAAPAAGPESSDQQQPSSSSSMQAELEKTKADHAFLKDYAKQLEERLEESSNREESLQSNLAALQEKVKELQASRQDNKVKILDDEEGKRQQQQLQAAQQQLSMMKAEAQAKTQQYQTEIQSLQMQLQKTQEETASLHQQLEKAAQQLAQVVHEHNSNRDQLTTEIQATQEANTGLRSEVDTLKRSKEVLEKNLREQIGRFERQLEEQAEATSRRERELLNETERLNESIRSAKQKEDSLIREMEGLKISGDEHGRAIEDTTGALRKELEQSSQELSTVREDLRRKEQEMEEQGKQLIRKLHDRERELEDLKVKLLKRENDFSTELEKMRNSSQEILMRAIGEKDEQFRRVAEENQVLEDTIENLEKEKLELADRIATLSKDLAQRSVHQVQEAANKGREAEELKARIVHLEAEAKRAESEFQATLESEAASHQEELAQLVGHYKKAHEEDVARISTLERESSEMSKLAEDQRARIDALENEADVRVAELKVQMAKIRDLEQRGEQRVAELEEQMAGVAKLGEMGEAQIAEMRRQMEEIVHARDQTISGLEEEVKALKDMAQELGKENQELLESLGKYKQRVQVLETEAGQVGQGASAAMEAITHKLSNAIDALVKEGALKIEADEQEGLPVPVGTALRFLEERWTEVNATLVETQRTLEQNQASVQQQKNEYDRIIANLKEEKQMAVEDLKIQYQSVLAERSRAEEERDLLVEKLTTMKNTIAPRMQAEMEEGQRLRSQVESLTAENESLRTTVTTLESQLSQIQSSTATTAESTTLLETELGATREELAKTNRELDRLRHHLLEAEEISTQEALKQEEKIREYSLQIEALGAQREEWEAMAEEEREQARIARERLEEAKEEVGQLREEMERMRVEAQRNAVSLGNLQAVLEEFQASKETEIEFALEGMRKQLNNASQSLEEFKARALAAEEKLAKLEDNAPTIQKLQQELGEKNVVLGKLRHDIIQYQAHLSEAMRRMKDGSEDNVDRRLITNLVVQFMNAPRGDRTRFEILSIMSGILKFTDDEKYKVGLVRRPANWAPTSPREQTPNESFTDMWISFLLKESNTTAGGGANANNNNNDSPATATSPPSAGGGAGGGFGSGFWSRAGSFDSTRSGGGVMDGADRGGAGSRRGSLFDRVGSILGGGASNGGAGNES